MRPGRRLRLELRGHSASVLEWGAADGEIVILLHGWMDGAASFQFIADRLDSRWRLIAPDQRGFGDTEWTREPAGGYWFPEYVADVDALVDHVSPAAPVHLVGHSLGGNVACLYAGIRPDRVKSLVSLDGFGLPNSDPADAAERYRRWLDASKAGVDLKSYPTLATVADRLQKTNPRLPRDRAEWIAAHWAAGDDVTGWRLRADPAHKLPFPTGYRLDEAIAIWREVSAPTLWIGASLSEVTRWLGYDATTRVPTGDEPVTPGSFAARLAAFCRMHFVVLEGVGHMLHHEAPERVAPLIEAHWRSVS